MRIEKGTCGGSGTPLDREWVTIAVKTLFRYGAHSCGPYLRTNTGFIDLSTGTHTVVTVNPYRFVNYKELPNAVLYTVE